MEGGTTGGELIELERNSDSEDGLAVQIQELALEIKAEEQNLFPQAIPLIPDIQEEAVLGSIPPEQELSFSEQKLKLEENKVLNKGGSNEYNQTHTIDLVQENDAIEFYPHQDRVDISEKEEAETLIFAVELSNSKKLGQGGASKRQANHASRNMEIQLTPSFPFATSTITAQSEENKEPIIQLQASSHGNASPSVTPAMDSPSSVS